MTPRQIGYPHDHQADPNEIGDAGQERLALLSEAGLDLEDTELCEYTADVLQAEDAAFSARNRAGAKSHSAFKGNLSRSVAASFSTRSAPTSRTSRPQGQDRLQEMQIHRPLGQRCNICPSTQGGSKAQPQPEHRHPRLLRRNRKEANHGGKAAKVKPSTVYFSIPEPGLGDGTSYKAYRVPRVDLTDREPDFTTVPPLTSLQAPPASTPDRILAHLWLQTGAPSGGQLLVSSFLLSIRAPPAALVFS